MSWPPTSWGQVRGWTGEACLSVPWPSVWGGGGGGEQGSARKMQQGSPNLSFSTISGAPMKFQDTWRWCLLTPSKCSASGSRLQGHPPAGASEGPGPEWWRQLVFQLPGAGHEAQPGKSHWQALGSPGTGRPGTDWPRPPEVPPSLSVSMPFPGLGGARTPRAGGHLTSLCWEPAPGQGPRDRLWHCPLNTACRPRGRTLGLVSAPPHKTSSAGRSGPCVLASKTG